MKTESGTMGIILTIIGVLCLAGAAIEISGICAATPQAAALFHVQSCGQTGMTVLVLLLMGVFFLVIGVRQLRKRKQEEQYDFETEVEQTEPARKATGLRLLAFGAYKLDGPTIDSRVTKTSPGAYAVGIKNQDNHFYAQLVGRSDTDVRAQLKEHIGKYDQFKFEYFDSSP